MHTGASEWRRFGGVGGISRSLRPLLPCLQYQYSKIYRFVAKHGQPLRFFRQRKTDVSAFAVVPLLADVSASRRYADFI